MLGELIGADLVEYFEITPDRVGLAYSTSHDQVASRALIDAFEAHRHQNPIGAFRWRPGDGAIRLSAVTRIRQLQRLGWWREVLTPLSIRDQLKIWLARSATSAVCVSFDRAFGTFSDRDAAVLEVLQPHLLDVHRSAGATPPRVIADEPGLTTREAQVLTCAVAGMGDRQIAAALFISPGTVRKHLEHAYQKLGVSSRTQAAARLLGLREATITQAAHDSDARDDRELAGFGSRAPELVADLRQ